MVTSCHIFHWLFQKGAFFQRNWHPSPGHVLLGNQKHKDGSKDTTDTYLKLQVHRAVPSAWTAYRLTSTCSLESRALHWHIFDSKTWTACCAPFPLRAGLCQMRCAWTLQAQPVQWHRQGQGVPRSKWFVVLNSYSERAK